MTRVLRPLARAGFLRHGNIFPLIAACVALSLIVGTMLSVMTVRPASDPKTGVTSPAA